MTSPTLYPKGHGKGTSRSQLKELAKPFPAKLISQKPAPNGRPALDYVSHSTVTERLLQVVGLFEQKVEQLIHDAEGVVVGALVTLTVEIDGKRVSVTEAGDKARGTTLLRLTPN